MAADTEQWFMLSIKRTHLLCVDEQWLAAQIKYHVEENNSSASFIITWDILLVLLTLFLIYIIVRTDFIDLESAAEAF